MKVLQEKWWKVSEKVLSYFGKNIILFLYQWSALFQTWLQSDNVLGYMIEYKYLDTYNETKQ